MATQSFDYKFCADSVALLSLLFGVLYYVLCEGREGLVSSKWVQVPADNQ